MTGIALKQLRSLMDGECHMTSTFGKSIAEALKRSPGDSFTFAILIARLPNSGTLWAVRALHGNELCRTCWRELRFIARTKG